MKECSEKIPQLQLQLYFPTAHDYALVRDTISKQDNAMLSFTYSK